MLNNPEDPDIELSSKNKTHIEEFKKYAVLDSNEKLQYLMQQWGIKTPKLYGVARSIHAKAGSFFALTEVRTVNGDAAFYNRLNEKDELKSDFIDFVYIGNSDYEISGNYLEIEFELANLAQQKHKANPFLIQAKRISVLEALPLHSVLIRDDLIYIKETITKKYIERNKKDLEERAATELFELKNLLEKEESYLKNKKAEIDKDLLEKAKGELLDIELKVKEETLKLNESKGIIESLKIQEAKINRSISQLYEQEDSISNKVKDKKEMLDGLYLKEKKLSKHLDELKSYIKARAAWFRKMDFISESYYQSIAQEGKIVELDDNCIPFKSIENSFPLLVNHIHSYTFSKGIIYPRYLIEDFLSLLRTNDFIILSGLSGSGKTQIVKSVAEAMGGIAKIIPVKPNWTSSEDLLGYYNPLQKSYLSTPFLDALIEAKRNPEKIHIICLDEMNLARVEYYFADFLSALETRDKKPEIILYSDEEAEHIISEFKSVIRIIDDAKSGVLEDSIANYGDLLKIEDINKKLRDIIGLNETETFVSLHSRLRRMISGVLNIPSRISFPLNVRIVGAINIDETTHYLSPKVLDRAHVVKFESPLRYDYEFIKTQIQNYNIDEPKQVFVKAEEIIPIRGEYPSIDNDDYIVKTMKKWANDFLENMGIDIGLRPIRQAMLYRDIFIEVNSNEKIALNNVVRHKILPRFSVDGNKNMNAENNTIKAKIESFYDELKGVLSDMNIEETNSCHDELLKMIKKAENSDNIFNYWV